MPPQAGVPGCEVKLFAIDAIRVRRPGACHSVKPLSGRIHVTIHVVPRTFFCQIQTASRISWCELSAYPTVNWANALSTPGFPDITTHVPDTSETTALLRLCGAACPKAIMSGDCA